MGRRKRCSRVLRERNLTKGRTEGAGEKGKTMGQIVHYPTHKDRILQKKRRFFFLGGEKGGRKMDTSNLRGVEKTAG